VSLGHLLFKSARLLDEQALARVRARSGITTLRPAHTKLLPHIDLAGTRLTDLAARLGVSKQAAGQLVDELIELGMLERVAHPEDGRARMVRFSARGRRGLLHGLGVLQELEGELATAIGAPEIARLRELLARLLAALERQSPLSRDGAARP
jgi:DNA-binding MarR family transcriptional regulator